MTFRTLQKWHAAGNDFLVEVAKSDGDSWWDEARARAACLRSTGVGADGIIVVTSGPEVSMVLRNADGSRAEMSGNGIRCVAAAVRRTTGATGEFVDIRTDSGLRRVALVMDGDAGYASVSMGKVTLGEALVGSLGVAHVGNPHVVVADVAEWTDSQREDLARSWSDQVGGANVEFVTPIDREHVALRVIERGVGWTRACGTGSCASAAVLHEAGVVGPDVMVLNPGGELRVQLDGARATLSGPVQFVADVRWLVP